MRTCSTTFMKIMLAGQATFSSTAWATFPALFKSDQEIGRGVGLNLCWYCPVRTAY